MRKENDVYITIIVLAKRFILLFALNDLPIAFSDSYYKYEVCDDCCCC